MDKKILALIPARGGSKGVPRKNIRHLGGHPLLAYAVEICKQSSLIGRFLVSTDDEEIAEVARQYGADVPFLRPPELARDDSPVKPTFTHALDWLQEHEDYVPDFVIQLRPTSPFRKLTDIENVVKIWRETDCEAVRSVSLVETGAHPYQALIEKDGVGEFYILDPEIRKNFGRQWLPPFYKANGLVDAYTLESVNKYPKMRGNQMQLYKVQETVNIDTETDFEFAEFLMERGKAADLPAPQKIR